MIKIIAIGKIKESYLQEAINDYSKRIRKYSKLELIELKDSDPKTEFELINKHINKKDLVILLDVKSDQLNSLKFSDLIDKSLITNPTICFIIGGSNGFYQDIYNENHKSISFSKLTFPHQLFRLILLEQIYRSYKILNNETYHK